MFDPKNGDTVIVCYDGKLGRAVAGTVKARRGFALSVEFVQWAEPQTKPVTNWFVRTSPESFGGFLRVKDSLMRMLVGTPGDWYSVFCPTTLALDGRVLCACGRVYYSKESCCPDCGAETARQ